MTLRSLALGVSLHLLFFSCQADSDPIVAPAAALDVLLNEHGGPDAFRLPAADDLEALPQDPRNPLSPAKVALGQLLFHETAIATNGKTEEGIGTFSCASCHFAGAGFQAGRFQGIGDGGLGFGVNGEGRRPHEAVPFADFDVQPIRSPSALNTAYQEVMLWNGQFGATGVNAGTEDRWTPGTPKETNTLGYEGLETQAIAGLTVHRMALDARHAEELGYRDLFQAAFPGIEDTKLFTPEYAGLAIAAYERTLVADQAPWQRYLRGEEEALNPDALQGAILFLGKAGCVSCHTGPALSSNTFHALGMDDLVDCEEPTIGTRVDNAENLGRGGFTGKADDNYRFKVPQLYNLKSSPFYGHGSSFRTVRDVIAYKNRAEPQNARVPAGSLSDEFQPLGLTEEEIDQLAAFVRDGLYDPNLERYAPLSLPSGQCFPNNDDRSRKDLDCY
ncbi:cytochrome c peroxidase [Lewinella marina]|uniref:Cytochrome-c peroxidase n=1 Tax=Neolewinella marina TaxID=438751 RepID=A0A2G0CIJ5_9BACT|nr:cytochrome c peroxidase [Neolewinella marina]NJB85116.1 cytochrome c peroxidase [Neolewinella marina]PHK99747.1 cytochrome-c peroxidase [Neolewinella marina]